MKIDDLMDAMTIYVQTCAELFEVELSDDGKFANAAALVSSEKQNLHAAIAAYGAAQRERCAVVCELCKEYDGAEARREIASLIRALGDE